MPTTDDRENSFPDGTEKPAAVSSTSLDSMHLLNNNSNNNNSESSAHNNDRASAFESTIPYINVPAPQKVSPVLTHQTNQSDLHRPSYLSNGLLGLSQPAGGAVPEFLYQLTKMLTDNNKEVIEWSNGMIKVHNPPKLESQVMHKYFRHSKFSSFQRQLNYFGFRKLAGKGKMAPCSYVNEASGKEINSLLRIKRKSGATVHPKDDERSRPIKNKEPQQYVAKPAKTMLPPPRANPIAHGPVKPSNQSASSSQLALARTAVGRGIRHGVTLSSKSTPVTEESTQVPDPLLQHRSDSLSQLASNYQHTLTEHRSHDEARAQNEQYQGYLSRDSSLVDLAMIPSLDDVASYQPESASSAKDEFGWGFVDFPYPELDPSSNIEQG